jgi:hypothetical protein
MPSSPRRERLLLESRFHSACFLSEFDPLQGQAFQNLFKSGCRIGFDARGDPEIPIASPRTLAVSDRMEPAFKPTAVPAMFGTIRPFGASLFYFDRDERLFAIPNDEVQTTFFIDVPVGNTVFTLYLEVRILGHFIRAIQAEKSKSARSSFRLLDNPFEPIRIGLFPFGIKPAMQPQVKLKGFPQRRQLSARFVQQQS